MGIVREASIRIAAPAEAVWEMIADVTRMGEFSPENEGAVWLDGATTPAVGVRFRGTNRRGKANWSTTCEIIACDPPWEFAWAVGGSAHPETRWRYVFTPAGGGTDVTESFELVKPIGRFSRLLTRATTGVKDREADMEQGMHETLARLKQAAEQAGEQAEGGRQGG